MVTVRIRAVTAGLLLGRSRCRVALFQRASEFVTVLRTAMLCLEAQCEGRRPDSGNREYAGKPPIPSVRIELPILKKPL